MSSYQYEDEYFRGFGRGEYADLKAAQAKLDAASHWETFDDRLSLKVSPDPMQALANIRSGKTSTPAEVFEDTFEHTQMMLVYGTSETCLRECAMSSLINTAGLNGPALMRSELSDLITMLTLALKTARDKTYLLHRSGKIAAVVSGKYEYMPISELLESCEYLEMSFGAADFIAGSITHSQTFAQWEFPDVAEEMTKAYNSVLTAAGRPATEKLIPVVQFQSSDTSDESAKLLTYLKLDSAHTIPIGTAAVEHKVSKSGTPRVEQFREEVSQLFSKLEYDIGNLIPKMLATPIHYPANVFISLCLYSRIPQKWGGIIEEELREDWPNGSGCSFLDIYEALTKSTSLAIRDGFQPYSQRVMDLEEGISKIARNQVKWTAYDLPGTVAWNPAKIPQD